MPEPKLAPKLPQWRIDHANCYISSGGSEAHIYTVTPPGYSEMHVPSLLLTTTGRKSGEKYVFPLFYGDDGNSYIIVASKGGAPDHPGWYKNLRSNPDVEVQVGRKAAGPSAVQRTPSAGTEGAGRNREGKLGTQDATPAAPGLPRDQPCPRAGRATERRSDRAARPRL